MKGKLQEIKPSRSGEMLCVCVRACVRACVCTMACRYISMYCNSDKHYCWPLLLLCMCVFTYSTFAFTLLFSIIADISQIRIAN